MKQLHLAVITSFLSMIFYCQVLKAGNCPLNLAEQLQPLLKSKIDWVDINTSSDNDEMSIRYYPCYETRSKIDKLLRKSIFQIAPKCKLLNPGRHKHLENYCVLENIKLEN